jgi:hypothetical protein
LDYIKDVTWITCWFPLDCIMEWISRQPTCPVDRRAISVPDLKPVPRWEKPRLWQRFFNVTRGL